MEVNIFCSDNRASLSFGREPDKTAREWAGYNGEWGLQLWAMLLK